MNRTIIHLDLDAFFASVEQKDRPELQGSSVIVGGQNGRGVVCAASYEARRFGVCSAMPTMQARKLCPEAVFLPVRMERYRQLSRAVFAIYRRYTDLVEPLSIDEAFLDVTGSRRLFGTGEEIAARIRSEVKQEVGLTVSAGVAGNKFLAKMACEQGKPDGLFEVPAGAVEGFLHPLPLSKLWGIGKVTASKLTGLGYRTVADLAALPEQRMVRLLGEARGRQIHRLCFGLDDRDVRPGRGEKSIGAERTFATDLYRNEEIGRALLALADEVGSRARQGRVVGRCLTIKVRYGDFSTITRSHTQEQGVQSTGSIYDQAVKLAGKTDAGRLPVRLLGITLSELEGENSGQIGLFDDGEEQGNIRVDKAMDELRRRFGSGGVTRATLLPERD